MKHRTLTFLAGLLCGVTLFGGSVAYAAGIVAEPSPHQVVVNGQPVEIEGYLINGHNYYQLRDLGEILGFGVAWDGSVGKVVIDTTTDHLADIPAPVSSKNADGSINLPSDGSKYVPAVGDVIRCDDGSNYTVTDVSRYDNSMFASDSTAALPAPTCDWSLLPQPELPAAEARHFTVGGKEYLFIRDLYESRRMLYTLYNAIGANPETWQDGAPVLFPSGNPKVKISLTISEDVTPQSFWPWRESEIINLFNSCPPGSYSLEAWDVYCNGIFQYTEYKIHVI